MSLGREDSINSDYAADLAAAVKKGLSVTLCLGKIPNGKPLGNRISHITDG